MTTGPCIALWGMMGTGKSTLGCLLADELGVPFIDVDEALQQEFSSSITQFFKEFGEAAFRKAEQRKIRSLLQRNCVLSLGGGALLDDDFRNEVHLQSQLFVLQVHFSHLKKRLLSPESAQQKELEKRVLLQGECAEEKLKAKLFEREAIYRRAGLQIEASGEPTEVLQKLLAHIQPLRETEQIHNANQLSLTARISVPTPKGPYDVMVKEGLLARAAVYALSVLPKASQIVVVYQPLTQDYAEAVVAQFKNLNRNAILVELDDGEQFKNWNSVSRIHAICAAHGLSRQDFLMAVGGGVVGDLTGFAAATWMRGMAVVQVPTTLLSMVDASVGGKTAINHAQGKNLVGAFHFPSLVLVDPQVLQTLDEREVKSGLAEMLKHSLLQKAPLFLNAELGEKTLPTAAQIAESIQIKAHVVAEDPFEKGRRAMLNLGHTFGHAVEHLLHYAWTHGECVALGMLAAAELSAQMGFIQKQKLDRLYAHLEELSLPISLNETALSARELVSIMKKDKKAAAKKIKLVLLHDTKGTMLISAPDDEVLQQIFQKLGANP